VEKIDPVRYISNYSSGKMGFALAEDAANRGAEVLLIAGPVHLKTAHPNITRIDVTSAEEMYRIATEHFPTTNVAILCAAVADYKPLHYAEQKIKRHSDESLSLELTPNPDIAATLGKMKQPHQQLIGFALETNNEILHAKEKLQNKNLDFIVLNSLQDQDAGFQKDTNKITILDANGEQKVFPVKTKKEVAHDIINLLNK
jgi:phosphopantothenoylcysteine decarboxylase/phosphopantothenate--cysteine ligase